MYSTIWCYKTPESKKYTSFEVRYPITRDQAIFIAKRKHKIKIILEMIISVHVAIQKQQTITSFIVQNTLTYEMK